MVLLKALILFGVTLGVAACESVIPIPPPPQDIEETPEGIFIVDITGKEWEITTAVEKYNLEADRFNYGLGPHAIPPINFPKMLEPGDPSYPSTNVWMSVIGADINGEQRAYKIVDLNTHEVVNEVIGGEDVFVGW